MSDTPKTGWSDHVMETKTNDIRHQVFTLPVYTWKFTIGQMQIHNTEEQVPNWFHRQIQYLVLGIKWERLK